MTSKAAREIREFVKLGKLELAFKRLEFLLREEDHTDKNQLLILLNQYQRLERQMHEGLIHHESYTLQQHKIIIRLLTFIENSGLDDDSTTRSNSQSSRSSEIELLQLEIDTFYGTLLELEKSRVETELQSSAEAITRRGFGTEVNIQTAKELLISKQIDLERLLDSNSPNHENIDNLKDQLVRTIEPREVVILAERILKRDINVEIANRWMSQAYMALQDPPVAILYQNRLLSEYPNDVDLILGKAQAFKDFGNLNGAIAILVNAQTELANDKRIIRIIEVLGRYRLANQEVNMAEKLFKEAIEIDKESPFAYLLLGDLYAETGRYEEAVDQFLTAIEIDIATELDSDIKAGKKPFYYPFLRLGQIYYKTFKDNQGAIQYLEKAYEYSGNDHLVVKELTKLYLGSNKTSRAIALYQTYLEENPLDFDTDLIEILARAEIKLNKNPRVGSTLFSTYASIWKENPNTTHLPFLIEQVKYFIQKNQLNDAYELLEGLKKKGEETLLEAFVDNFRVHKYIGIILALLDSHEQAFSYLRNATNLHSGGGDAETWQAIGEIYSLRNQQKEANDAYNRAIKIESQTQFVSNIKHPLTISDIEISEIYFFDDTFWKCQPQVNVLLGRNGFGKSYFLRFLVAILQEEEQISRPIFEQNSDISPQSSSNVEVRIKTIRDDDFEEKEAYLVKRLNPTDNRKIGKIPVLAIPDVRFLDKSREQISQIEEKGDLAENGAFHFLYQQPIQGLIQNFLFRQSFLFNEERNPREKARSVFEKMPIFRLLEQVYKELTGTQFQFHDIKPQSNKSEVGFSIEVITEGNQQQAIPLQKTSQGTLSIMAIFGLIYHYLNILFPHIPSYALYLQKAIVVIDEVDAHLHPSWQRKIVYLLRKTFPNIQFFLTAHSPLVVGGCYANEVSVLKKNKQSGKFYFHHIHHDFIGWDPSDLYDRVFSIEGIDETYFDLQGKYTVINSLRRQIDELKVKKELSLREQEKLRALERRLNELRVYESILQDHERGSLRDQLERLESDYRQLKYDYEQLKIQVQPE